MRKSWSLLGFEIDTQIWHIIPCFAISTEGIMIGWLCFYLYGECSKDEYDDTE